MQIPRSQSVVLHAKRVINQAIHGRITQELDLWLPEEGKKISGNRLFVTISDIHFTDGTVGIQNLSIEDWGDFFGEIKRECKSHELKSCYLVFDGDLVDFIRTDRWAKSGE